MLHTEILEILCRVLFLDTYLEIGVQEGDNFERMQCLYKVGLDPDPGVEKATHHITSKEFFNTLAPTDKFDLIFIDGDHRYQGVFDDIESSMQHVSPGGVIVVHDMLPTTEEHQIPGPEGDVINDYSFVRRLPGGAWTGDGWKAWVYWRARLSAPMFVVDTDWGCGIIWNMPLGAPLGTPINEARLSWESFCINKHEWMGIISQNKFFELVRFMAEERSRLYEFRNDQAIRFSSLALQTYDNRIRMSPTV